MVTGRPRICPPGGAPTASIVTEVPAANPLANVETCPGAFTAVGVVFMLAVVQVGAWASTDSSASANAIRTGALGVGSAALPSEVCALRKNAASATTPITA
jgi:hypothetical protein